MEIFELVFKCAQMYRCFAIHYMNIQ